MEVWALAGQNLPKDWSWTTIRQEIHPKETYFAPYVAQRGLTKKPGQGRVSLGRESAANYKSVRPRCLEDVSALERRLAHCLSD